MDFLLENSEKFLKNEWSFPYWMIYQKDRADGKVLEFLKRTEGYLIEHNGFDDVMCFMGEAFAYKLPTKKAFMDDAEKRFQMLSDSMDRFTELSLRGKAFELGGKAEDKTEYKTESGEISKVVERITSQADQQRLFREAVVLYNDGKYEEAWGIEKQLVELNPQNPRYHYIMGATLHEMERYEETEREIRKAVELKPDNAEYHAVLGLILHEMERYEEAESAARKAIELKPDSAEYYKNLGFILCEMERYEEAESTARKTVELEPDNAECHDNFGLILGVMGKYEEAEREIRKAIELEPENQEYSNHLENALSAMKE